MARNPGEDLLYSANIGCLEGVKAAMKAGADINYTQHDNVITGRGTALFSASVFGHVDVVRLLLRKGASVWKRTDGTLSSPLHATASRGHTEVVELLVHHGATLDIRDGIQVTPLMTACIYKQVDTARRLIELGARVDLADRFGRTPQRSTLKLCGRCKLTRYCSRDCQKQHWTVGHKKCCGHDACADSAKVTTTDCGETLPCACGNVPRNTELRAKHAPVVRRLEWGTADLEDFGVQHYDYIMGSDIIYKEETFPDLHKTIYHAPRRSGNSSVPHRKDPAFSRRRLSGHAETGFLPELRL
ncbi:PREDICTED: ankyrin repeat domain-containing protein 16-like [Branchiostoma belcheri]|uniref:Ankyrin repeat domain-containing protein 16-like n=1 Tax=Branchiostoma belcheri TaxID=7741 RepID=A0A6P5AJN8_BRABE|nr:PREDICTED: ankyrin repeat domain-containing protein 16-like [Branchiostoma belcheri]